MNTKYIFRSLVVAGSIAGLSSCYDMNTEPLGEYKTDDQKTESKEMMPERIQAGIVGISSLFSTFITNFATEQHCDFGVPSVMLGSDCRGIDMVNVVDGYNWFSECAELSDCNTTSRMTEMIWGDYYSQIRAANAALATINPESEDPVEQFYMAQGLAMRANAFFMLAQFYQQTYAGNEEKPCIMLITEKNETEAALNGCERSTVSEVYDKIIEDLTTAIDLLAASGISPQKVIGEKPKRFVSLATAYGLRARVNLVMNLWPEAYSDAMTAIQSFNGNPLSMAQAAKPGFNDISAANWMWGIAIAETDRVVTSGIINFPSHLGSFNYGYASVGAWKQVNKALFDGIAPTDARKGWFVDANCQSANLTEDQQAYIEDMGAPAYTQVKFAPYKDELNTSTNASDIPLMRVEEMYLIAAEAAGMAGANGAGILQQFVQTYRDPAYACPAAGGTELQDEIWRQRRIEFYGEGISYTDLLRLKKPLDRRGGGWEITTCYNIPAGSPVLIYPIPESEINGNKAFSEADNNTSQPQPTPVPDVE